MRVRSFCSDIKLSFYILRTLCIKNIKKIFFVPPHSVCSKFSCGSRGGLCFALKRREVDIVYPNVRYTTKNTIWNLTSEREQTGSHERGNPTCQASTDITNINYDMLSRNFAIFILPALSNRSRHNLYDTRSNENHYFIQIGVTYNKILYQMLYGIVSHFLGNINIICLQAGIKILENWSTPRFQISI